MRFHLVFLALLLAGLAALAAEPPPTWGPGDDPRVPPAFAAWHPGFEDDGDYGESWFTLVRNADGTLIFVLLSVTNLGLHTFDGSVDVQVYPPAGPARSFHAEVGRDAVEGATDHLDMRIDGARTWGREGITHLRIQRPDLDLSLDLANSLPSWRHGDGRMVFRGALEGEWTHGELAPRARAAGHLHAGDLDLVIDGVGYTDHGWATVKLPAFLRRWTAIRVLDPDLTLVLHQHDLTERFGGGSNRFALLGTAEAITGATRAFTLRPTATREVAGQAMPTAFALSLEAGGTRLEGTIEEVRFLDAIDVLGRVSLPVRLAIKALYTDPWMLRWVGRYRFRLTGADGASHTVAGTAIVEVDTY